MISSLENWKYSNLLCIHIHRCFTILAIMPSFAHFPLPTTLTTTEGGNLTIPCHPEAAPQPVITWSQNGGDLGYGDARRQILIDGTLHVTDVTRADDGVYTCKAINDQGEATSSTRVTVACKLVDVLLV